MKRFFQSHSPFKIQNNIYLDTRPKQFHSKPRPVDKITAHIRRGPKFSFQRPVPNPAFTLFIYIHIAAATRNYSLSSRAPAAAAHQVDALNSLPHIYIHPHQTPARTISHARAHLYIAKRKATTLQFRFCRTIPYVYAHARASTPQKASRAARQKRSGARAEREEEEEEETKERKGKRPGPL